MKNHRATFETIYSDNYGRVLRLCLGYVKGDTELAKDLTQEVFVKVWENLNSFRNESAIATWIYRITVNTCLLQLRNKRYLTGTEALEKKTATEEETPFSNENRLAQMYACINKLNEESKGIILLELEGLPQKEIAAIMGLSHQAVRVRIHRIKNSLTKCVQHELL
ncbi:sigma-70 family RNA polymerase sigma factor [Flavobacteriaceae bacterium TP-CH-4]|uniref:Sigma-70 family RNA polymerase sigma factor n=1 Tax=Pelagihabitans pacificus TaxID=2696054 RepID=A0A967AX00_9FLAO|nr:sigma-70 family RNA polymerase sigma factor [Pelagihabitans pacificus]NHF59127.1 sigma-70 family RNA polymerase sigma factor [Pelagihabitans pacificus]